MRSEQNSSPTQRKHWQSIVSPTEDGMRLDQVLPRLCPGLSRTQGRRVIDIGGVHLCGRRVRSASRTVKTGETLHVYCDGLPLEPYRIAEAAILYRDRDIVVLDKPAGIETQPTPARYQGTLYAALRELLLDPFRPHLEPSIGMMQRLDRDTSGVILFSISPRAHKPMTAAITSRGVHKRYLALVLGNVPPGEQEICSLLARCHRDNRVRTVARGGQEAVTRYRLMRTFDNVSLVEVEPVTGRMHQIRAHLSEAGFPLLGDLRYDGPEWISEQHIPRHMLHASRLDLLHPVTHHPLQIESSVPADFQLVMNQLANESIEVIC